MILLLMAVKTVIEIIVLLEYYNWFVIIKNITVK